MGKLSVYLPDELEARTKAAQPDVPTSQVIRVALERYLGGALDKPAYAEPPDDVEELLAAGVAHFADAARADYQDGYRAALTRLPDLDWYALSDFARHEFDLYKWLEDVRSGQLGGYTPDWIPRVADDVGHLANPIDFDKWSFRKTPPWERGYGDGLQAGYEAALRAGALSPGGSARNGPAARTSGEEAAARSSQA